MVADFEKPKPPYVRMSAVLGNQVLVHQWQKTVNGYNLDNVDYNWGQFDTLRGFLEMDLRDFDSSADARPRSHRSIRLRGEALGERYINKWLVVHIRNDGTGALRVYISGEHLWIRVWIGRRRRPLVAHRRVFVDRKAGLVGTDRYSWEPIAGTACW